MAIQLDLDQLTRIKERSISLNNEVFAAMVGADGQISRIVDNVKNDKMTNVLNDLKSKSEEARKSVVYNLEALVAFLEKQIANYSELSEESSNKFQSVSEKLEGIKFE